MDLTACFTLPVAVRVAGCCPTRCCRVPGLQAILVSNQYGLPLIKGAVSPLRGHGSDARGYM